MVVSPLIERLPQWTVPTGPDHAETLCSHLTITRNLADFPFPERCTEEEKRSVEERILQALEHVNVLSTGHYYGLDELDGTARRFLAERRLLTMDMVRRKGPAGIFVSDDQSLSITINGVDHLTLRVLAPGQQAQEAWTRLNLLDDTLGGALDFAFNERLGFLSSLLDNVGTSLKASVLLHLPAIVLTGRLQPLVEMAKENRLALYGLKTGGDPEKAPNPIGPLSGEAPFVDAQVLEHIRDQNLVTDLSGAICGPPNQAEGDLFLLVNTGSLGESEEEILFHLRHVVGDLVNAEKEACSTLLASSSRGLEDRVNRALGVARHARLLGFSEGLNVLSALRLGITSSLLDKITLRTLNEVLLASQGAQLETAKGQPCDALTLSMERADLFRSRFS